jgi:uncharacterized protein YdeI (YjbR/CyaY-like superfamily)
METGETLEVASRKEFRDWLACYHMVKSEIWLIYYYGHTGKQRLGYGESVEEAICFGWIDSQHNKMDVERFVRRFSPRRRGSRWSQHNRKRALKMLREGLMTEAGFELLPGEVIQEWEQNRTGIRSS